MAQTPDGLLFSQHRGPASPRRTPDDQALEQAAAQLRPSWADVPPPAARATSGPSAADPGRFPDAMRATPAAAGNAARLGGHADFAPRVSLHDDDFDEELLRSGRKRDRTMRWLVLLALGSAVGGWAWVERASLAGTARSTRNSDGETGVARAGTPNAPPAQAPAAAAAPASASGQGLTAGNAAAAPVQAPSAQAAPAQPALAQPAPAQPALAQPALAQPAPAQAASAQQAPSAESAGAALPVASNAPALPVEGSQARPLASAAGAAQAASAADRPTLPRPAPAVADVNAAQPRPLTPAATSQRPVAASASAARPGPTPVLASKRGAGPTAIDKKPKRGQPARGTWSDMADLNALNSLNALNALTETSSRVEAPSAIAGEPRAVIGDGPQDNPY